MNIILLGAGRVGQSVAESLLSEDNDITVIDQDPDKLRLLEERLDLRGVVGNGIQPSVLEQAGARDAEMLIACAASDEANLVVCKVAHSVFNIPSIIARLRSPEFTRGDSLLSKEGFAVDHVICPEASVERYIHQLIDYPEALQVLEFADGRVHLIVARAALGGSLLGRTLGEFKASLNKNTPVSRAMNQSIDAPIDSNLIAGNQIEARVVAVYRNNKEIAVNKDTIILENDEVFVLANTKYIRQVLEAIHNVDRPVKNVMIGGGGRVGLRLARGLVGQCDVKLIEVKHARCMYLTSQLPSTTLVLNGDCADENLLIDENVGEMDLFLALTSDDEDNIMAAMLAKRLGARRVMALINRRAYADMMEGSAIDITISPANAVIGELLTHVRKGDVVAVHSLRYGAAEALEGIARGDAKTSRLVGRRIDQIQLPPGARIGMIVRGKKGTPESKVLMPHHDTMIESGDHIVIFIPYKRWVHQVERLFQVSATFM